MKRIVIDARYVRERPSGIGAMVDAVVRLVPARMPDVEFVLLQHPRARVPLSPAPNARGVVVSAEANGPGTLFALPRLVDLRGADLFHAPFNILPHGLVMPTLVTIHDVMWLDAPELCRSRGAWGAVEEKFYAHGIRHALDRATAIASVSEATKQAIARRDPRAAARTTVIHHGVDDVFRRRDPADRPRDPLAVRRRLFPGFEHVVLTVGQGAGYKNHAGAVRGFAAAFRDRSDVALALVQRLGRDAEHLLAIAKDEGVADRVRVLDTLPLADLIALYGSALCLLHPSLVEGWGMPITEAMAAGCPVVTSDRAATAEAAGGAGLLVDPTDPRSIGETLARLERHPDLRGELSRLSVARAAKLTWDAHAERTAALYRSLL